VAGISGRKPATDDYSLLIQHTRQLSVTVDPASGSRWVLEKLADRLGTRDSSNWWASAKPVQEAVRSYLEQVVVNLPEWLQSPEVSISEALPYTPRQDLKPALSEAISRERERQFQATSAERYQMRMRQSQTCRRRWPRLPLFPRDTRLDRSTGDPPSTDLSPACTEGKR
jgi:hypothetical protein